MPIEKSCDLCKKQGLAIMPVRYAVVPGEATAPKLAAPFKIEDASTGFGTAAPRKHLASLGTEESANYTLRRMRAGYLYVYNEKAALKLQGYSVSSGGYFLPLPPGTLAPIPQAGKEIIPCNEKGHQEAGSCITDKLLKGLSVVGAVIGAVQALMDVVDASDSYKQAKLGLMWTQVISGIVGFGAAGLAIWAAFATGPLALILIGVGLVLAVALLLISKVIDAIKGDEIAQWLERCYWGSNLDGFRINDTETEQEDFKKLALTAAEG